MLAPLILRTAQPLLQQVQHCLALALADDGGGSSSSSSLSALFGPGGADSNARDAVARALVLQQAVLSGVLDVWRLPGSSEAAAGVMLSDSVATAALQQLLAACTLLRKQAELHPPPHTQLPPGTFVRPPPPGGRPRLASRCAT